MPSYEELIKDFATDDELKEWAKEFAQKCKAKHVDGLMAVTAPQSEQAWIGMGCISAFSAQFLLLSLLNKILEHMKTTPAKILAGLFWYTAQVEAGHIDPVEKIVYKSREKDAIKLARYYLQKAIKESHKDNCPTLAAQIRQLD